jgi:4-amino-4-deoxy-L-arabinose transferase-like glycosyltransferase
MPTRSTDVASRTAAKPEECLPTDCTSGYAAEPVDTQAHRDSRPIPTLISQTALFVRKRWGLLIVVATFGWFVATDLIGVDFGYHWDEPAQLDLVNHTIATKSFLPNDFYDWPPVTYLLSLVAVAPRVIARLGNGPPLTGDEFFVTTRSVFIIVTGLGGLWLYLAGRRLANEVTGAMAAAVYLLSWELAYHSRWIAPDAIAAQVVALFLLAAVVAAQQHEPGWRVYLPAAAAAAATATKYTAGVLLIPAVILAARARSPGEGSMKRTGRAALAAGAFAAFFLDRIVVMTRHELRDLGLTPRQLGF